MSYSFDPKRMYRMPTHFGPAYGPRQSPDGVKFNGKISHKTTTVSVSFLSNAAQLRKLLPPGFNLYGDPIVTIFASYMKEIQWLAGRGYNVLGVTLNAEFSGKKDTLTYLKSTLSHLSRLFFVSFFPCELIKKGTFF